MDDRAKQLLLEAANAAYSLGATYHGEEPLETDFPSAPGFDLEKAFINDNTGFKAMVFHNEQTGEYIVAYAGTEDLKDAHADLSLGPNQFTCDVGRSLDRYLVEFLENDQDLDISVTGRSLGGTLAWAVARTRFNVRKA